MQHPNKKTDRKQYFIPKNLILAENRKNEKYVSGKSDEIYPLFKIGTELLYDVISDYLTI